MMHECQIERQKDVFAYREQYLIRCRCHQNAWVTWRPGEPEFVCDGILKEKPANAA